MVPNSRLGPGQDDIQLFNDLYAMVFDELPQIDDKKSNTGYTALPNQENPSLETNTCIATQSESEQHKNTLSFPEDSSNNQIRKAVDLKQLPATTTTEDTQCLSTESHEESDLKPLSAYNFFFRDERNRIIQYGPSYDSNHHRYCDTQRYSKEHQDALLEAYWKQDRTSKRKHRKSHGMISFTDLSKTVSKRWKELTIEERMFYQQVASKDRDRYQNEILTKMRKNSSSIG